MRFRKLFFVVAVICSANGLAIGQSQPENGTYLEQDPIKSVHIYPNPATEWVNVKLETVAASKVKLTLHNIIGNEMPIETEVVDEFEVRVKVKDLASGYYLLAVKDDESKFRGTYKFLKR